jgi:cell division protease FtsH
MNPSYKNLAIWLMLVLVIVLLFNLFNQPVTPNKKIPYSEFKIAADRGDIRKAVVQGNTINGTFTNGDQFSVNSINDSELIRELTSQGVIVDIKPDDQQSWLMQIVIGWFPMLLLIGVWIFFMRQMQGGGGKGAMSFGKSKARLLDENQQRITFADVAGIDEAKHEVEEIIDFLKDPKKYTRLGGKIPKGAILIGAPGTGKTLLARAIAGEADVPFFSISGSDFVEMFVGVGAARVRDLFIQGKKNAPCIIFVDEIDAVGRHRGAGLGGGHDEREQTLNQLLVEMDGFESNEGVIIVAATNRPDVLDPALLRPGRFDRRIVVPLPDVRGRQGILKVHANKTTLDADVKLQVIARGTPGFTGADLANLVNEAALLAAREGQDFIAMRHFDMAKDKVLMGTERKSMIITQKEKKLTAYHEAGHTLVATKLPGTDPIHKVTIIPRGMALGLTQQLPIDEKHTYARDFLNNNIAILLGGRIAEEIIFNEITTGAGNDIERSTDIARKMVCNWGMSDKIGPLSYGKKEEQIFLGREIAQHRDYSEATAIAIDEEVKNIVDENHNRVTKLLTDNKEALIRLAEILLERETLDADEIDLVLNGEELPPIKINGDGNGTPVNVSAEKPAEGDNTTKKTGTDKSSGGKGAEQPL